MIEYFSMYHLKDFKSKIRPGNLECESRLLNDPKREKYILNAWDNHRKIGYISFHIVNMRKVVEVVMKGIFVERGVRGNGYGHQLIIALDRLATQNCLEFNRTTKQRKPITCAILAQDGFQPTSSPVPNQEVLVGRVADSSSTGLYFRDPAKAEHFQKTKLFKHENYSIQDNPCQLIRPVTIKLNSSYIRNG